MRPSHSSQSQFAHCLWSLLLLLLCGSTWFAFRVPWSTVVYCATIRTSAAAAKYSAAQVLARPSTVASSVVVAVVGVANGTDYSVVGSESNATANGLLSLSTLDNWTDQCPCRVCETNATTGYRQIICDTGPIYQLPIYQIPHHIELIEIVGSSTQQNNLTLGPLFYRFPELKVLRVVHSNVPAIGQTTFQYRTSLTHIDLSYNVIENLIDANFKGLRKLEKLNLSFNRLTDLTSAPFQHLIALRNLNLSHNAIKTITTRLFYNLTSLESLDLSSNPIEEITPQNTIDLRPLRRLYMSHCRLRELHSLFYRNVPNLQVLDLRHNRIATIHKHEFRHLPNLTELRLDGNHLAVIPAVAFYGIRLRVLGLGSNLLVQLHSDAFRNSTVVQLDLSSNNFTHFEPSTFSPLATCLQVLDLSTVGSLVEPSETVAKLIAPLSALRSLSLANLSLESTTLPTSLFTEHRHSLRQLNLSHNAITQLNSKVIEGMVALVELDLSYNSLFELDSEFLYLLSTFVNLTYVYFDHNPWSCFRCHLLYFRNWIAATDRPVNAYQNACEKKSRCAQCAFPANLENYEVHKLEEWQLEWCTDPTVQLRVSTTEPNVGLVLALLIIIILIIVIVGVIVYYRNRGAIYFTNEDLLYGQNSVTHEEDHDHDHRNSSFVGGGTDDAKSGSTVYNLSSRIRYFAEATASPPDSHSLRSGSSVNSLVDNHRTGVKKPPMTNGHVTKSQPIRSSILSGGGSAKVAPTNAVPPKHRDSNHTTTDGQITNGAYAKPNTILRKSLPKKQSSTASSTNSSRGTASVGRNGPSRGDSNEDSNSHPSHYERLSSGHNRYRTLKSSSRSDKEEQEPPRSTNSRLKRVPPPPPPPPPPPKTPHGSKPPIPPKKSSQAPTKHKPIPGSAISLSASSSESEQETPKRSTKHAQLKSDSEQSSESEEQSSHSRPHSLPSALRPYDETRSSAEVEEVEEDEEEEGNSTHSNASSAATTERRPQIREESSPDSSTAALAEGGSTSPSSTRSSDFTSKSPLTE